MKLLICTQVVDKNHPILGFFHRWVEEFAKHFDEVHVICLFQGEFNFPKNVHVYSLGKEGGENRLKYIWRFYKNFGHIFFTVRVDYVFFHMGAIYNILAAPFFLIRKLFHTKFYWWKTHGHIDFVGRIALLFVDRVYTGIEESFPIHSKKRVVVGHAIDTDLFESSGDNRVTGKILFVGRFSRSKRIEQFIQIVHDVLERGEQVSATCIGTVADEAYYQELKQMIQTLGVADHINFIEGMPHDQLVSEYQSAHVFINPSDNDGLDKVVLEAMLCGVVPLSANHSFLQVLSSYGLYMKKGDIDGYVEAVTGLLHKSDQEYLELSQQLADDVQKKHALKTITQRIFNLS